MHRREQDEYAGPGSITTRSPFATAQDARSERNLIWRVSSGPSVVERVHSSSEC